MSYIPDYRKEVKKLNEFDRGGATGFNVALESVRTFLDNLIDEASLSIEREILEKVKDRAEEWLECEEIEFVCSLFDNADYLPDDTELVDANREA